MIYKYLTFLLKSETQHITMDFTKELQQFGLSKNEVVVYTYLLEQGISTPPQIAKGTAITRTNCYHLLQSLKEKGLIESHIQGKRKTYVASDPDSLLRAHDKKREALIHVVPDLRGLYTRQKNKPKVRFFDGYKQIQQIYLQSLEADQIHAIGSTKHLSKLGEGFFKKYMLEVKKKGIIFNDILTHASHDEGEEIKNALKGLYDQSYLPSEYNDFPTDILIWNNHIALITLSEPIFGTILTNPQLAQTFRMMFDMIRKNTH